MIKKSWWRLVSLAFLFSGGASVLVFAQQHSSHDSAPLDTKNLVVQLCDGKTNVVAPGVKPGERLAPEQARAVSDKPMSLWKAGQPAETASRWEREANGYSVSGQKPDASKEKKTPTAINQSDQPVDFSPRDHVIWDREVTREVEYGNQLFHDDKLIGSTVGIACAMCHPNGSNTHPETYPKFQIQLKRVALLRDMINWCIENPIQGKKLEADDPKVRALEAYILAQRKGVPLEPGKH